MAKATAAIEVFTLYSYWTTSGGSITAGPTTDSKTKSITVRGVPQGATVQSAVLSANISATLTGTPRLLDINGESVETGDEQTVSLTPTATGNGTYQAAFRFQAQGTESVNNGQHIDRVMLTNITLTVTYTAEEPGPTPDPVPDTEWDDMPVSVFAGDAERFGNNGLAVLTPTYGRYTAVAGGKCEITLRHPIDPEGKWAYIVPEAIIRVPVPEETIENAFIGIEVDLYRTNQRAAMREGPSEPTAITYQEWSYGTATTTGYTVGAEVTCSGIGNYQCLYWDSSSGQITVPPYNSSWWKKIASQTSGSPVLVQLSSGEDLYFLEDAGSGWYFMSTPMGLEGYIKSSQVTFVRHMTPEESQERIIRNQLFRVVDVTVNTKTMEVEVYAEHVSYDLAAILVRDVQLSKANPAFAINRVMDSLITPYRGTVSTNLTTDEFGTYTGKMNGKNGIFAFLDPDSGIVPAFKARFTRDNWDMFVLRNTHRDRGARVKYGKNAVRITWKRSRSSLALRVVPVAKDEEGNDYYLPELFVDSPNIGNTKDFPVPRMMRLSVNGQIGKDDGTETNTIWTAEALCAEMRKKAQEVFDVDHADEFYVEIDVDFEQLGASQEYAWLKSLKHVLLYDVVHAEDERIGLETALEVTELEWDFIRKKITRIKASTDINHGLQTVAGYNVCNNSIGAEKLTEAAITEIANLLT